MGQASAQQQKMTSAMNRMKAQKEQYLQKQKQKMNTGKIYNCKNE